ncbi:MAG: hypothetical protein JW780_07730 [Clostridiales bacterium]|nr:hypothetical protein [Clostridiales bacterium]
MRRSRRKTNVLKYKFLYVQIILGAILFTGFLLFYAPELIIIVHQTNLIGLLRILLGITIAYVAAPLIVIYIVRAAILEHKGMTRVNWRTYLNDSLYYEFCSQPSDVDPNDYAYWKTQEIIASKRAEHGEGFGYAVSGSMTGKNKNTVGDETEDTETVETAQEASNDTEPAEAKETAEARKGLARDASPDASEESAARPKADPLAGLPKYDPNGPNPFTRG